MRSKVTCSINVHGGVGVESRRARNPVTAAAARAGNAEKERRLLCINFRSANPFKGAPRAEVQETILKTEQKKRAHF